MAKRDCKKEMEYEDSPCGYVTLYNYKEPFMEYEKGYGYLGVLLFDGESDKVQCHICGEWFHHLCSHLKHAHRCTPTEYKQEVGLMESTALIGEKTREKFKKNGKKNAKKNFANRVYRPRTAEEKAKISKTMSDLNNERQNITFTCYKQLIDRYKEKKEELGRQPRYADCGWRDTAKVVFGSWKNYVEACGDKVSKYGRRKTVGDPNSLSDVNRCLV